MKINKIDLISFCCVNDELQFNNPPYASFVFINYSTSIIKINIRILHYLITLCLNGFNKKILGEY